MKFHVSDGWTSAASKHPLSAERPQITTCGTLASHTTDGFMHTLGVFTHTHSHLAERLNSRELSSCSAGTFEVSWNGNDDLV
jgi:hypothetical protein